MASQRFSTFEHQVPCQYIREYPHATTGSQESTFHLAVKQYKPKSNLQNQRNGITLIVAPANGMPKEIYEPLWDDLFDACALFHVHINGIWVAEMSHQGDSGILNEKDLGNDPHWFDHSRDLLHMINLFRNDMPLPIFGLGHSLGAAQMVFISNVHPRLFSGVILINPLIRTRSLRSGLLIGKAATFRKDAWSSETEAEKMIRDNQFYKNWDPRVVSQLVKYSFRRTSAETITLKTSKHQEAFTIFRPNWDRVGVGKDITMEGRRTHPDIDFVETKAPFYRPEPPIALGMLSALRPPALFVFGTGSEESHPEQRQEKVTAAGSGPGGSGGARHGFVCEEVMKGGHFVPMENPAGIAGVMTRWLQKLLKSREESERAATEEWDNLGNDDKQRMSKQWFEEMRKWKWNDGARPGQAKL